MPISVSEASPRNGVLLLSGYGVRVAVERGHLRVEDGVGTRRRTARFSRADRELRRLVVLGHSGTISLDALRWLSDVGAAFAQIDSDGRVIAAAGPIGLHDGRLRRAQAQAAGNGRGLEIARGLIRKKLTRQRALLDRLPENGGAKSIVTACIQRVGSAPTIEQLRGIESEGAAAYWKTWAPVEVRFTRRDAQRIPTHWQAFERRASTVTGKPRKASNAANAILNYLYAITETEARIAALAVGCDPTVGFMHADKRSRDSLASDLMEPVRPVVDSWLLDLLESRAFRKQDFFETRAGACRIMPPLTRLLAETAPRWTAALAPIAEGTARELMSEIPLRAEPLVPTPLTQGNRRAGRRKSRKRPATKRRPKQAKLATCSVCGGDLTRRQREFCLDCQPLQAREAFASAQKTLRASREAGNDPAHGGDAARRRGKRTSEALSANAAWSRERNRQPDPDLFSREIAPRLSEVSVSAIVRATGLSRPYCAMIRRGTRVPHPRHWGALRGLS